MRGVRNIAKAAKPKRKATKGIRSGKRKTNIAKLVRG